MLNGQFEAVDVRSVVVDRLRDRELSQRIISGAADNPGRITPKGGGQGVGVGIGDAVRIAVVDVLVGRNRHVTAGGVDEDGHGGQVVIANRFTQAAQGRSGLARTGRARAGRRVGQAEQRPLRRAVTDEVLDGLAVIAQRNVAVLTVVPFSRGVEVLRDQRLQRRVARRSRIDAAGIGADGVARRADRSRRIQRAVLRTGVGDREGHTADQAVGHVHRQVEARQQVGVVRLDSIRLNAGALDDREVVLLVPTDAGRDVLEGGDRHVGVFVTDAGQDLDRTADQARLHGELGIASLHVFFDFVMGEAAGVRRVGRTVAAGQDVREARGVAVVGLQVVIGGDGVEAVSRAVVRRRHVDRLELALHAEGLDVAGAVRLHVARVQTTPVTELSLIALERRLVDVLVGVQTEAQLAVVVDLVDGVELGFVDLVALRREVLVRVARSQRTDVLSAGSRVTRIQLVVLDRRGQVAVGGVVHIDAVLGDVNLSGRDRVGRRAVRIVATRSGLGRRNVEVQGPVVGRLILNLQAGRLQGVLDRPHFVFIALVLTRGRVAGGLRNAVGHRNDRIDERVAVEGHGREGLSREPVGHFRASFAFLHFRIEGVGRDAQVVHRLPLQDDFGVVTLHVVFGIGQTAVGRNGDQLIHVGRRVGDDGRREGRVGVRVGFRRSRSQEGAVGFDVPVVDGV